MNCALKAMMCSKTSAHATGHNHAEYDVCHKARYWEQEGYHKYMHHRFTTGYYEGQHRGKHFSKALACWAIEKNVWNNGMGMGEHWTCEQVETALKGMGVCLDDRTRYDAYYLANTKYADHISATPATPAATASATTITEAIVLQLVCDIMRDKDGYDGMIFEMWIAKAMGMCWDIPFCDLM